MTTSERPEPPRPAGSSGQLPVSAGPVAPALLEKPRGPYVPTVLRGLFVLALVVVVFVWRLVDDPDWAVVGIAVAVVAGALLLLASVVSVIAQRARREREFDRMLNGS